MATTYSSRTTNPIGGSQVAGGGLWYNLPIDGFNKRDAWAIFNDFETFGQFDATNDWAITAVNTPGGGNVTFALVNSATTTFSTHGVLGAVTGTTVSSGYTVQALGSGTLNGQGITPIAGRSCAFEIKVGTTTATGWTDCSWFFGLCAATASNTIPISNVGALTRLFYRSSGLPPSLDECHRYSQLRSSRNQQHCRNRGPDGLEGNPSGCPVHDYCRWLPPLRTQVRCCKQSHLVY